MARDLEKALFYARLLSGILSGVVLLQQEQIRLQKVRINYLYRILEKTFSTLTPEQADVLRKWIDDDIRFTKIVKNF